MLIQTDLCSFLEKLKKYNRQPAGVNEKRGHIHWQMKLYAFMTAGLILRKLNFDKISIKSFEFINKVFLKNERRRSRLNEFENE